MAQPRMPWLNTSSAMNYKDYRPQHDQQMPVQCGPAPYLYYDGFTQYPPPTFPSIYCAVAPVPAPIHQPEVAKSVPFIPNYQPVSPMLSVGNQTAVEPIQKANIAQHEAEDKIKLEAAVSAEKQQQHDILQEELEKNLRIQRVLRRELNLLQDQTSDLKHTSSTDSRRFCKKNEKLQIQIIGKLKIVNNAIEILNDIIGVGSENASKIAKSTEASEASSSPDQLDISPTRLTQDIFDNLKSLFPEANISGCSFGSLKKSGKPEYNYIHYDPEMHWCKDCDKFPKTADDYLKHLHSKEHQKKANSKNREQAPWHLNDSSDDELPINSQGDIKRLPLRGLQHLVPVPAWFCKLCNKWMGDLHCANLHLKSKTHFDSYSSFLEHNPHWEMDWLSSRQKIYENKVLNKKKVSTKSSIKMPPKTRDSSSDLGLSPEKGFRKRKLSSSSKSTSDSDSFNNKINVRSEKPKSARNFFVRSSKTTDASYFDSEKKHTKNRNQRSYRKHEVSSNSESGKWLSQTKKSKIWNFVDSMYNKTPSTQRNLTDTASTTSNYSSMDILKKSKNKIVSSSSESGRWISDNEDSIKLTDKVNSKWSNNSKSNFDARKWIKMDLQSKKRDKSCSKSSSNMHNYEEISADEMNEG